MLHIRHSIHLEQQYVIALAPRSYCYTSEVEKLQQHELLMLRLNMFALLQIAVPHDVAQLSNCMGVFQHLLQPNAGAAHVNPHYVTHGQHAVASGQPTPPPQQPMDVLAYADVEDADCASAAVNTVASISGAASASHADSLAPMSASQGLPSPGSRPVAGEHDNVPGQELAGGAMQPPPQPCLQHAAALIAQPICHPVSMCLDSSAQAEAPAAQVIEVSAVSASLTAPDCSAPSAPSSAQLPAAPPPMPAESAHAALSTSPAVPSTCHMSLAAAPAADESPAGVALPTSHLLAASTAADREVPSDLLSSAAVPSDAIAVTTDAPSASAVPAAIAEPASEPLSTAAPPVDEHLTANAPPCDQPVSVAALSGDPLPPAAKLLCADFPPTASTSNEAASAAELLCADCPPTASTSNEFASAAAPSAAAPSAASLLLPAASSRLDHPAATAPETEQHPPAAPSRSAETQSPAASLPLGLPQANSNGSFRQKHRRKPDKGKRAATSAATAEPPAQRQKTDRQRHPAAAAQVDTTAGEEGQAELEQQGAAGAEEQGVRRSGRSRKVTSAAQEAADQALSQRSLRTNSSARAAKVTSLNACCHHTD